MNIRAACAAIGLGFTGLLQAQITNIPIGHIDARTVNESSGLVAASQAAVFWTLNDAGNAPRLFPMRADGKVLNPAGVLVDGTANTDWESLDRAPDGRLIIAECGNNANRRQDLALLLLPEPDVKAQSAAGVVRVPFRYPDQARFPPPLEDRAYDCEAIYTHRGKVYALTKDRGPNRASRHYRFRHLTPQDKPQVLEALGTFRFGEMVTGAEARGDRLAVLTYRSVWIIGLKENGSFGAMRKIPFRGLQCEAISWFDDDTLLITNEQRGIYRLPVPASLANPKVLLIGDSISLGYTQSVIDGLNGEFDVTRIKGNGQDSAYGVKNIDNWLTTGNYDIIHFNWGLWDLCYRHPESKVQGRRDKVRGTITATPEQYGANLTTIVDRLQKTDALLVWRETSPVPEAEAGRKVGDDLVYNRVAEAIMRERGIHIHAFHKVALEVHRQHASKPGDVHFTKEGSRLLGQEVCREIRAVWKQHKLSGK